ncbi:MAG: TniQ family protein [Pyrinomonadaceae bacterium]
MTHHTYPYWDVNSPTLPARSRLYNLEPVEVGTLKVESLTGYVARLAEAHCISTHTLLHKEAFSLKKGPNGLYQTGFFGFSSNLMNGVGSIAEETATALGQLTSCQNIHNTTLLKWKNILSPASLLRRTRKWCATCYAENIKEENPVYEPLIFAFEAVSICPWHFQPLSSICFDCKSQLPMLTSRSHPGHCSRCKRWLGLIIDNPKDKESNETFISNLEVEQQISMIDSIGELLIKSPTINAPPTHQSFIANLTKIIDQTAGGSINSFADLISIWSGTVRRLLSGATKPRLEVLYRICSRVNISLLDLLMGTSNEEIMKRRRTILRLATPMPKERIPWVEVEGKLREALQESPPSSMEEVARRMGYYQPRIRYNFPELCAQIVSRYKEQLISKHPDHRVVRKIFRAAFEEQPPPSLQSVLRRLGCQDTGYYYYHNYPNLCSAVAQRFKSYRNKPFNINFEREQLETALIEDPAPSLSEMSKRLGRKRDFLHRKFPELTKAIATRHLYYRTSINNGKAEKLRETIREAVQQIVASGLYVSEAKVRAYVIKHLHSPGRSSLFKQALREIKAEMGIS